VRDVVPDKVAALNAGDIPIYEPGLADVVGRNADRLRSPLAAGDAGAGAGVVFVCVDTPPTASGDADLSRVWAVVEALQGAVHLKALVVKSTVPTGTGAKIRAYLDRAGLGHV